MDKPEILSDIENFRTRTKEHNFLASVQALDELTCLTKDYLKGTWRSIDSTLSLIHWNLATSLEPLRYEIREAGFVPSGEYKKQKRLGIPRRSMALIDHIIMFIGKLSGLVTMLILSIVLGFFLSISFKFIDGDYGFRYFACLTFWLIFIVHSFVGYLKSEYRDFNSLNIKFRKENELSEIVDYIESDCFHIESIKRNLIAYNDGDGGGLSHFVFMLIEDLEKQESMVNKT